MLDPINLIFTVTPPTSYTGACVFGGTPTGTGSLNTNNWIQINLLVILLSFSISAVIYALGGIFSASMREKLRGAAKYEAFQGVVSIMIIMVLIGFSAVSCQTGAALTVSSSKIIHTSYQDPMQFAESYIGNLMFTQGLSLFSQIYTESVLLAVNANIASTIEETLEALIYQYVGVSFSAGFVGTLFGFSGALGATFEPMIVVAFGVLFMIYLILPIIEALALTVIVPLALVMRSIPFAGPKLRESSDTFLALAIGFYFILPLAILMNGYIMAWIYSSPCTPGSSLCNPYIQFTPAYSLQQVSVNNLFNTPPQALTSGSCSFCGLQITSSFFSSGFSQEGGILSGLKAIFEATFDIPQIMVEYSLKTAEYMFEAVVLIGLDLAITLAFAQGLTKGLNAVSRIIGVGPFWGNV